MKSLVLCSGGLKSAFLLALAKREPECSEVHSLFIDYGQNNNAVREQAVKDLSNYYSIAFHKIDAKHLPINATLPFKLTYFLWSGFILAREYNCNTVYYGPAEDDYNTEATPAYLRAMQMLIDTVQPKYDSMGFMIADRLEVEAPVLLLDKKRIVKLGSDFSVPWELSWDCTSASTVQCGKCYFCNSRRVAFKDAGVTDPTNYAHDLDLTLKLAFEDRCPFWTMSADAKSICLHYETIQLCIHSIETPCSIWIDLKGKKCCQD